MSNDRRHQQRILNRSNNRYVGHPISDRPGAFAIRGMQSADDDDDDDIHDDITVPDQQQRQRQWNDDPPPPAAEGQQEQPITLQARVVDEATEEELRHQVEEQAQRLQEFEVQRLRDRERQLALERERLEERERLLQLEMQLQQLNPPAPAASLSFAAARTNPQLAATMTQASGQQRTTPGASDDNGGNQHNSEESLPTAHEEGGEQHPVVLPPESIRATVIAVERVENDNADAPDIVGCALDNVGGTPDRDNDGDGSENNKGFLSVGSVTVVVVFFLIITAVGIAVGVSLGSGGDSEEQPARLAPTLEPSPTITPLPPTSSPADFPKVPPTSSPSSFSGHPMQESTVKPLSPTSPPTPVSTYLTPSKSPTPVPTDQPSRSLSNPPTPVPTDITSTSPTIPPTPAPTDFPTRSLTNPPTPDPTVITSTSPTNSPTPVPTDFPSKSPTKSSTEPANTSPPTNAPVVPDSDRPIISSWIQKGQDLDGEVADDRFGYAVAISSDGSTVAASAHRNSGSGNVAGHVRVFQFSDAKWEQLGQDLDGEGASDLSGVSMDLSADGLTVAVGAMFNDDDRGRSNTGHVRVHKYNSTSKQWDQLGQDIDGDSPDAELGVSIALSDDGNVLAARGRYDPLRVFRYDTDASKKWIQIGPSIWDGELEGGCFAAQPYGGLFVSISGDGTTVACGCAFDTDSGFVNVYRYDDASNRWSRFGDQLVGSSQVGNTFGYSISLSADGMIIAVGDVGAVGAVGGGENSGTSVGEVRVFRIDRERNQWEQLGQSLAGETAGSEFGSSVALSADGSIVAAAAAAEAGPGYVRVFWYDSNADQWDHIGSDIEEEEEGDQFGRSIAISANGGTIAAGAPWNDGNGGQSGSVRVFQGI